jgi:hypothetical protein
MDPRFISCGYSAQKFFSLVHTASGAAMFTISQQQGKLRDQGKTSIM